MNNTFSLHRVALYARKHYTENSRSYLYGLLGLIGLTLLSLYYIGNSIPLSLLLLISCIYFTLISSQNHYAQRSIEQSYTLPATAEEKYFFIWLNSAIAIPLATTAICLLLSSIFSIVQHKTTGLLTLSNIDSMTIILFLLMQSGTLFCCSWLRGSPLKAYAIVSGILIGIFILYFTIFNKLVLNLHYSIDISNGTCYSYIDAARISYPLANNISEQCTVTYFLGFWMVVFWVMGYFKFKERTLK